MSSRSRELMKFAASRMAGLAVDVFLLGGAYLAAILLRFDLHAPRWGWRVMAYTFVSVALAHVLSLVVTGCYRLSWRRTRLHDLPRYLVACAFACAALTVLRTILPIENYAHVRPPYTVTLITFVLAFVTLSAWRIIWSWYWQAKARNERLLMRPERGIESSEVKDFFRGKTVMVTGAGGSIGSEIVSQVAAMQPKRLLMVERGENALYEINRRMDFFGFGSVVVPLMKDVNDDRAMESIFAEYHPEIVLHAAAYKHVPMVEANPEEGWRNNTEATRKLAELSERFAVSRFVLISTDKAVNPVSVMGKTKRAAEQAVMAMSSNAFCAVRFGNVLGSSGSVVPLFQEQISNGGPVTVTDPEMKRYFMTISEAVSLVLQAASRTEKAIYTLDMGEPVRIVDLAEMMIRKAGYRPYVDMQIKTVGIRPGEKIFEELDVSEKSCFRTDMAKIYINHSRLSFSPLRD